MTGCIFYTYVMSKIPFVTLTNVTCCYAHKFSPVPVLAYECGQDSVVGIVTAMGRTVWGLNPGGSDIFHTSPYHPWGPPNLLYNGYWVFLRGKSAGA